MLRYCEPCPGYRNATFCLSPEPRNTPCDVRAVQTDASSRSNAFDARSILRARSLGELKSMAMRSGAVRSLARGASWPSARLASASALRLRRRVASSTRVSAPRTMAPLGGAFAARPETAPGTMSLSESCRLRSVVRLPGTYSSSTAWKLVPPKPNALTPARRTPQGGLAQSLSSVLT